MATKHKNAHNGDHQKTYAQRLSPNQFALMRAIERGTDIDGDETLRSLNMTTFGALIKRGYVTIDRKHNPTFTPAGLHAYQTYRDMEMPTRQKPGDVTEYVSLMLGLKRQREAKAAARGKS